MIGVSARGLSLLLALCTTPLRLIFGVDLHVAVKALVRIRGMAKRSRRRSPFGGCHWLLATHMLDDVFSVTCWG